MSLKGYAILAAVTQHQQQQQRQQQQQQQLQHLPHNATVMSTATTTAAIAATMGSTSLPASSSSSSSSSSEQKDDELLEEEEPPLHSTYYQGGIGLYYQQLGNGIGGTAAGGGGGGGGGIAQVNGAPGSGAGSGFNHGSAGGSGSQSYAHVVNGSVNLLLGGSMLCLVTTILCVVCYCCHRNIKKRTEAAYRQQQHQWLENDPNMEIYSVEQCYETSGLFLGDSTDGLAALPALHHEPPPSYDAVVLHEQQLLQQQQQQLEEQQLQLQQQQLLLQRVSPPPGYRSTLDISCLPQSQSQASPGAVASVAMGSIDALPGGSGSCSAVAAGGDVLAHKQLHRTLNAQSCCSLQRAEVENMWNAAAAAVVARNGHCQELEMYMASASASASASPSPPLPLQALQARKNAQAALRLNSFGRRYLQQSQHHMQQHSHYRRGCPLCGKFRYAADDEMLAASVESGLEQCDDNDNVGASVAEQPPLPLMTLTCPNGNQIDAAAVEVEAADAANGNVVDSTTTAAEAPAADADIDENDNTAATAAAAEETSAGASASEEAAGSLDIDNMNENGIISLDMSKIIDVSGLPTYEGALKLESSGYV
ncbi:hypothetical protein KR093_006765 [Drosophila rubida]|uniref:Uncharacterized protein n=1 Tax=Drosophila rubida TaxID=30044 RepID=A0AAD4K128_9MUSC|nr:hypothetical protein KR093_006765 [Drosophila rubida]